MPPTLEMERPKQVRLHPKHRMFLNEYLRTGNAQKAAVKCGYSDSYASGNALLKLPKIRDAIKNKLDAVDITQERVLREISYKAYANINRLMNFDGDVPTYDLKNARPEDLAAVAEVRVDETGGSGDGERVAVRRVTIKMTDQLKALEMLAKHLHLLDQRVEVDISDGLADRLTRSRSRVIDATPEQAQQVIEAHSMRLLSDTSSHDTYDDSFDSIDASSSSGEQTNGAAPQHDASLEIFSTSLPPCRVGGRCVPSILAEKVDEVEVIGIIRNDENLPESYPDVEGWGE